MGSIPIEVQAWASQCTALQRIQTCTARLSRQGQTRMHGSLTATRECVCVSEISNKVCVEGTWRRERERTEKQSDTQSDTQGDTQRQ